MPVLGTLYDAFLRDVIYMEKEFILFTNFRYLFSDPGLNREKIKKQSRQQEVTQ